MSAEVSFTDVAQGLVVPAVERRLARCRSDDARWLAFRDAIEREREAIERAWMAHCTVIAMRDRLCPGLPDAEWESLTRSEPGKDAGELVRRLRTAVQGDTPPRPEDEGGRDIVGATEWREPTRKRKGRQKTK